MAVPADLKYTKDHEWIRLEGDRAEIGITDFAQKELGDLVFVELPSVGTALDAHAEFGTVESVKAVSELFTPAAGEVTEVNAAVTTNPELLNTDPYSSWLIKIRLTEGVPGDLLDAGQYENYIASREG